ncbi:RHS repeat-associated core domain-containing protein [Polluticaenibacter yanchengensis]|uniref:T9SS type A sorting domain-containing protein n=1 Tax=Polluticaenibacter yanchengensis TaxID=3014562 RepID=A0ABT4UP62_9BACT|nr:T9SS type A sorting domain-containing protein [Chitinophagaceae bacterium LY-5]
MNTIYITIKQVKKHGCIILALLLIFADIKSQNVNTINKTGPLGTNINTLTGNFFLKRTDMYHPGRLIDLDISFNYNSIKAQLKRSYGLGWSFEYDIYYKTDTMPGRRIIVWGNGRGDKYDSVNTTAFRSPRGFFNTLTASEGGKLLLTETDGWKYYFDNPNHRRVTRIEEPNGNALSFNYTDTLLSSIVSTTGQTVSFQYNNKGLLTKITDETASPAIAYIYSYDEAGNLIRVTDPLAGNYRYTYLVNGPMKTMSDKNNNTLDIIYHPNYSIREIIGCNKRISVTYDQLNKKTVVTDHMDEDQPNQVTTYIYEKNGDLFWLKSIKGNCCGFDKQYEYDKNGNVLKETDAKGNTWRYTYDDHGNVLTETDPSGKSAVYTYTTDHKYIASQRDFNGNTTSYEYDSKGNLIKLTEPDNNVYTAAYNTKGEIISATDPKGHTFSYLYNSFGKPVEVNGPENYHATLQFDSRGNLTALTDANGNSTLREFDALNRLKKRTDALNKSRLYNYDAAGNIIKFTNAGNHTYEMKYDAANRMVKITNPASNALSLVYDPMDNITALTDPAGFVMAHHYDSKNRPVSNIDPLGNSGNITYDANGNINSISITGGRTIRATYDDNNRVTKIEDGESILYSYSYDNNGNLLTITDAAGTSNHLKYDKLNRVIMVTNTLGNSRQYTYDKNNNVILVTDENNQASHLTYDGLNRLTGYTDPIGASIHFDYDGQGNVIAITDQKGNITKYGYDALNRRTRMEFADGNTNLYTYDDAGNLAVLKHTDGTETRFTYNRLNQLTQKIITGGEVFNYTYDRLGRVLTAANNSGTVTLTYDAIGRVLSESFNNKTVAYSYNDAGRSQTITYPGNTKVIREFDTKNRLVKILKDSVLVAMYDYNDKGQLNRLLSGNGISTVYQYDFANRLSKITTGAGIQETTFGYDKLGNKLSVNRLNNPAWSEQMTYDANSRLTDFKRGSSLQHHYTYDKLGNRISANINGTNNTYTVNNLNQLTAVNNTPLQYDGRGNLVFDGTYHKSYNGEGLLIKDSSGVNNVLTYTYDAFGRRVAKTIAGVSYKYIYNDLTAIEERDGSDNLLNQTVFAGFLQPVLNKKNNSSFYYHRNELGSIETVTDAGGQLTERYLYDAYGKPSIFNNNNQPLSGSVSGNRFGFTGQEYDSATQSYSFFYRNYSPTLGIFNQRDPIEYEDGMGMYQYVGNNPSNGIDVFGLKKDDCVIEKATFENIWKWMSESKQWWEILGGETNPAIKGLMETLAPILDANSTVKSMTAMSNSKTGTERAMHGGDALKNLTNTTTGLGGLMTGVMGKMAGSSGTAMNTLGSRMGIAGIGMSGLDYESQLWFEFGVKDEIEHEAFMKFLEDQQYIWQVGETDEERTEKILKLSKIRKKQLERVLRKRKSKLPCDPGDQDFPDPAKFKNGDMWLLFSLDPNEIIGPKGIDIPKWVSINDRMPYTIYCENDETATAPARFVRITTPVQPKQDASTLELGSFGFNNQEFEIPPGSNSYYTRLDCRDSLGLYVDVIAGYDVTKNEVFWEFKAIDPVTLLPSEDPAKGVLLLRDSIETKNGHGFVNFSMKPISTANTQDLVEAKAEIVFDDNEMIPTNIHTNTIDAIAPQSDFEGSDVTNSNIVTLYWSGKDDTGGTGIDYYTIYVSRDGINYAIFAPQIRRTDTIFTLSEGGQYCFFILATDRVGNSEQVHLDKIECVHIQMTVLPVTWLYFTAVNQKTDNLLNWATATEKNTKLYIIERSFDGVNFEQIGNVAAAGNSTVETTYYYTDRNIDRFNRNTFFYRLKQVDKNGQYTYSNTVLVRYNNSDIKSKTIVYPNPTSNIVNIYVGNQDLVGSEAQLFDISGKMIRRIILDQNLKQIDISGYSNGTYLLRMKNGETLRIIKQ